MDKIEKLIYETKRKMLAKYPRFGDAMANCQIEVRNNLKYRTAATDGKNVFVDPEYFESLTEDERLFILAHEIMHKKFMHMYRLVDKNGARRNLDLWNKATDAIINANLERDGFKIKEGYVNRPEALQYSAEEFYDILLKEKEEKEEKKKQQGGNDAAEKSPVDKQQNGDKQAEEYSNEDSSNADFSNEDSSNNEKNENNREESSNDSEENSNDSKEQNDNFADDHSLWEEAFEQQQNEKSSEKERKKDKDEDSREEKNDTDVDSKEENSKKDFEKDDQERVQDEYDEEKSKNENSEQESFEINEKEEFEKNREEKRRRFEERKKETENKLLGNKLEFGNVGISKNPIDWKGLLRREIKRNETIWSQRRSISENNYAYRLTEYDMDDETETEVMIDVSGSVRDSMVKGFLRQLKPLLRESKLKVGCFNEQFWGPGNDQNKMQEIKSDRDIDNFQIPSGARGDSAWTEDWDLAVRSFSKKREVNKIVFTDGQPCPGTLPKQDLKNVNVIWLVYGKENSKFKPCCGKIIYITEKELSKMNAIEDYER